MKKLKMWKSGQIWFNNDCAYVENITYNTKIQKYDCSFDILYWLMNEGYEVEHDFNLYFNDGQTTWIEFSEGKRIGINNGINNEIYIVASLSVSGIKSFDYFDDVIKFERFYKIVKEKVLELISEEEKNIEIN